MSYSILRFKKVFLMWSNW